MKLINKFKLWGTAAIVVLSANSCSDFLDVNTSPNNLPESLIENVLPGAQIGVAFNLSNTIQIVSSLWMQHVAGTGTQTQPYDVYNVTPNDFLNDWNSLYAVVLDDLSYIIEKGKADGNHVHAGMAKILFAYTAAVTTDMWGDVPFSDALNSDESLKPKYEEQQSIYPKLIAMVNEAKADLEMSNVLATSSGDLIYGGNVGKWKKLANSLLLKFYLQMRKQNETVSRDGINALITLDNFIESADDNFRVNFLSSSGAQNPIYQYTHLTRQNDMVLSRRFYDSLVQQNDPRLPYYFTTTVGGVFATHDNGLNGSTPYTGVGSPASAVNRSRYGRYIVGNGTPNTTNNGTIDGGGAAPVRLITASMVDFWLAEAALTLGTTGDARAYFEDAIENQFNDIAAFVTNIPASFLGTEMPAYVNARLDEFDAAPATTGVGGKLHRLIREKWASSVGIAYEAYNDYRRTGFPLLNLAQNNQPGVNVIPYRIPYVQAELQSNVENVPLTSYPDGILVKLWWMGN